MPEHTITLFQYNQRQQPKHKPVEKGVVFDGNYRVITRNVLGYGATSFQVPDVLSPGLASRLVDMMKWNMEVDKKFHHTDGHVPQKYTQQEFVQSVWSLAAIHAPLDIEAEVA
jgi:hypothetical protein